MSQAYGRVPLTKSLRGRFSLVIALVAFLAISVISLLYSSRFEMFLNAGIRDDLTAAAEKSADSIGATVKTQVNQLTTFMAPLLGLEAVKQKTSFLAYLQGFKEFLTLSSFRYDPSLGQVIVSAGAELEESQKKSAWFQGNDPAAMLRTLLELERREIEAFARDGSLAPSPGNPLFRVVNLARESRLPVFTVLVRYAPDRPGAKDFPLVASSIWLTSLMVSLPKTPTLETTIVDDTGTVVGSTVVRDVLSGRSYASYPVVKAAIASIQPSGFYQRVADNRFIARLPEPVRSLIPIQQEFTYRGKRQFEWVGAFARIQRQGIGMDRHWIIVQKRAEAVFGVLKKSQLDTWLVTLFVVIGAIVVGVMWAGESTVQLEKVYRATGEIAAGRFDARINSPGEDEIGQIAVAVNKMAEELTAQVELKAEKGRLQNEADTARTVQETFFPGGPIEVPNLRMAGSYKPATECGGDLWGHFTVRPGVELVYIADAMGHGASAAIMTAMAYTACNLISDIIKDAAIFNDSPAQLLSRMNHVIFGAVKGKISMTCFAVLYDFNKGEMVYSNAGHNFPFVIFPSDPNAAKPAAPQSLTLSGNPLGVDILSKYEEKRRPLRAGERLFMFTDGLIECRAPNGNMWGRKALSSTLQSATHSQSVEEFRDVVVGKAFGFFATVPISDDVTTVVAEVDKNWIAGTPSVARPAVGTAGANTEQAKPTIDLAV